MNLLEYTILAGVGVMSFGAGLGIILGLRADRKRRARERVILDWCPYTIKRIEEP